MRVLTCKDADLLSYSSSKSVIWSDGGCEDPKVLR